MELCTAEEIHVICLFPDPGRAEEFGRLVYGRLPPIANRPEIFGRQLYMDDGDGVLGEEPRFLGGASSIPLAEVPGLAASCGGTAFPAHIDRPSFSLLGGAGPVGALPGLPPGRGCPAAARPELRTRPDLAGVQLITNSDAHYLEQVWGGGARHGAAPRAPRRRAGLAAGAPSPICPDEKAAPPFRRTEGRLFL